MYPPSIRCGPPFFNHPKEIQTEGSVSLRVAFVAFGAMMLLIGAGILAGVISGMSPAIGWTLVAVGTFTLAATSSIKCVHNTHSSPSVTDQHRHSSLSAIDARRLKDAQILEEAKDRANSLDAENASLDDLYQILEEARDRANSLQAENARLKELFEKKMLEANPVVKSKKQEMQFEVEKRDKEQVEMQISLTTIRFAVIGLLLIVCDCSKNHSMSPENTAAAKVKIKGFKSEVEILKQNSKIPTEEFAHFEKALVRAETSLKELES